MFTPDEYKVDYDIARENFERSIDFFGNFFNKKLDITRSKKETDEEKIRDYQDEDTNKIWLVYLHTLLMYGMVVFKNPKL